MRDSLESGLKQTYTQALILRAAAGGVSKDQGASSALWTLLRDAASLLLRMRAEVG